MTAKPPTNPEGNEHFEANEHLRTRHELSLIKLAAPRVHVLAQAYETHNYREVLATLTEDKMLDIGITLSVFRTLHEGHPVIARRPRFVGQREDIIDRASALALGLGTPRLEQPLAVSIEDEVIFSSLLQGDQSDQLQPDKIIAIPMQRIKDVVPTFSKACEDGLMFDVSASNIFYHTQYGFSFTDYHLQETPGYSPERSFAVFLYTLAREQSPFFDDSQRQAWQHVIQNPIRFFEEVYPGAGDVYLQVESDLT